MCALSAILLEASNFCICFLSARFLLPPTLPGVDLAQGQVEESAEALSQGSAREPSSLFDTDRHARCMHRNGDLNASSWKLQALHFTQM